MSYFGILTASSTTSLTASPTVGPTTPTKCFSCRWSHRKSNRTPILFMLTRKAAEKACAAAGEDIEECIFDMMATRAMDSAEQIGRGAALTY